MADQAGDSPAVAAQAPDHRRFPGWLVALMWLLLGLLLLALAAVLVRPCGLSLPGGGRPFLMFCPPVGEAAADPGAARLALEQDRQPVLEDRLRRLEISLARVSACPRPDPPVQVAEAPPEPEPPPEPPEPPEDIPEEDWEEQDLSLLEGCWSLINDMEITDINTRIAYPVEDWRICFNEEGFGEQTIVYENGTTCTGEIQADFLPDGRLRFADQRDIGCDGGFIIFRIVNECERLPDGTARCIGAQPDQDIADIRSIFRRHGEDG